MNFVKRLTMSAALLGVMASAALGVDFYHDKANWQDAFTAALAKAPAADHTAHAKTRHHRAAAKHHAAKRDVSATGTAAPSDQQYYPSVTVDWGALTPLAPPAFPGSPAQSFRTVAMPSSVMVLRSR